MLAGWQFFAWSLGYFLFRYAAFGVDAGELRHAAADGLLQRMAGIELGSTHGFAGFLGSQRNGRGVVFHVTELD